MKKLLETEIIRTALQKKGITQTKLAEMLGVTHSSVSHYLTNRTFPSETNLQKLSDILEIPIDKLTFESYVDGRVEKEETIVLDFIAVLLVDLMNIDIDGKTKAVFSKAIMQTFKEFREEYIIKRKKEKQANNDK